MKYITGRAGGQDKYIIKLWRMPTENLVLVILVAIFALSESVFKKVKNTMEKWITMQRLQGQGQIHSRSMPLNFVLDVSSKSRIFPSVGPHDLKYSKYLHECRCSSKASNSEDTAWHLAAFPCRWSNETLQPMSADKLMLLQKNQQNMHNYINVTVHIISSFLTY